MNDVHVRINSQAFWCVFPVSENKVLCHPSSVDSLTTSAGTEDHVSMGGFSARKCVTVVEHVEQGKEYSLFLDSSNSFFGSVSIILSLSRAWPSAGIIYINT